MNVLSFEIGGTTTRAALVDADSFGILRECRLPTPNFHSHGAGGSPEILLALELTLRELTNRMLSEAVADVLAVGYPGPVSPEGIALASPTLLGGKLDLQFDIAELGKRATGLERVIVINDVTACGFRYVRDGECDFCLVNVGSGIGNKLFLGGRPIIGVGGRGGEMGHFSIVSGPNAAECECGGRGHLAGISSGRGVLRWIRLAQSNDPLGFGKSKLSEMADGSEIDSTMIVNAFVGGDQWTRSCIEAATAPLSQAIAGVHAVTGVEKFILVGGFAQALGEEYRAIVARQSHSATWDLGQDWNAMVVSGRQGDQDGILGLAYAALIRHTQ